MRRYFKIGEMAKMFNMNIRTLRYYDEIDLLHPYHVDPEHIADLMRRQQEAIALQIARLKETQEHLAARVKHIEDARDTTLIELLRIEKKPERPIVASNLSWRTGDDLEIPLRDLENTHRLAPSYFLGKIGISMRLMDLQSGHFNQYHQVFCLPDPGESAGSIESSLPAGKWALWRYRGTHSEAAENWSLLMDKLRGRNLEPICQLYAL